MDAVGAVGGARRHLVQEHDIALPFLDPHGMGRERRQPRGQRRQLVIMRGEQRAAAVDLVQMLDRRPGDREPVEGRGAAADLVEDDQRARARLVEDRRRLDHLDHEGRAAAREIVGRADAAEQPVDDADMGRPRRHDRRRSAPARRSARSGAGRSICPPCSGRSAARAAAPRRRSQSLATKPPPAAARSAASTTGWRPALIAKAVLVIDHRAAIVALDRELGEAGGDIEQRPAPRPPRRSPRPPRSRPRRARRSSSSSSASALSAAVAMRRSSSPSSTVVKRMALAMVWRWMKPADSVSFSRWIAVDLDVIAQHIVVADLEARRCRSRRDSAARSSAPGAGCRRAGSAARRARRDSPAR